MNLFDTLLKDFLAKTTNSTATAQSVASENNKIADTKEEKIKELTELVNTLTKQVEDLTNYVNMKKHNEEIGQQKCEEFEEPHKVIEKFKCPKNIDSQSVKEYLYEHFKDDNHYIEEDYEGTVEVRDIVNGKYTFAYLLPDNVIAFECDDNEELKNTLKQWKEDIFNTCIKKDFERHVLTTSGKEFIEKLENLFNKAEIDEVIFGSEFKLEKNGFKHSQNEIVTLQGTKEEMLSKLFKKISYLNNLHIKLNYLYDLKNKRLQIRVD